MTYRSNPFAADDPTFDYRTDRVVKSLVIPYISASGKSGEELQQMANTALKAVFYIDQPGTVHTWRYHNGDVRVTFQPHV